MNLVIWSPDSEQKIKTALKSVLENEKIPIKLLSNTADLPSEPNTLYLALGKAPQEVLSSHKIVPKGRTTYYLRNKAFDLPNASKVMVSYAVGVMEMDWGRYVDLLTDLRLAIRYANTGSLTVPIGKYKYVDSFDSLLASIEAKYEQTQKAIEVAFDTETLGLDPYHESAYLVTLQFTAEEGAGEAVYFGSKKEMQAWFANESNWKTLNELLNSKKISLRSANGKYDMNWLAVHAAINCTNFKFDTTLVGSILDENRSNALNIHAKLYTLMGGYDDHFSATVDKSRMDLVPKESLLPYAVGDTDACLQVSKAQKEELLKDERLTKFYVHILHPAARAFERLERGGVYVDMDRFNDLESDLNTEICSLVEQVKEIIGGRIFLKHRDDSRVGGLNIEKASLIVDFMFSPMGLNLKPLMKTEKTKEPSSAKEHIEMFKSVPEAAAFVEIYSAVASASKTLSTYVKGFRKHIRSDGKLHPSYFLFAGNKDSKEGTNTGRLTAVDPAFQTLPKHTKWAKRIRSCYVAPPGFVIGEEDYSQGELKVVACVANELNMIHAYRNNQDLHVKTGGEVSGLTYEQMFKLKETDKDRFDRIRQLGKPLNFGLLYGMAAPGLRDYAEANYKVLLTAEESEKYRNGFFGLYPGLVNYHQSYKAFAKKNKHVRSPLGRIRHLPLINSKEREVAAKSERQAINSPIQATLNDMMLWAMAIYEANGYSIEAPYFGAIHDASYTYFPEDNWEFHAKRQKEVMENLPFEKVGWSPQLNFSVDVKIGSSMGELREIKF